MSSMTCWELNFRVNLSTTTWFRSMFALNLSPQSCKESKMHGPLIRPSNGAFSTTQKLSFLCSNSSKRMILTWMRRLWFHMVSTIEKLGRESHLQGAKLMKLLAQICSAITWICAGQGKLFIMWVNLICQSLSWASKFKKIRSCGTNLPKMWTWSFRPI